MDFETNNCNEWQENFTTSNEWILKEWISQWVAPKRMNAATKSCNEWVSLQTTDNPWKVMASEIKVLCDKIIVCSELP